MDLNIKLIAVIDVVLGSVIWFVCFCRAVVNDKTVLRRVRLKFVLLGPASLAASLSPLWGDTPHYTDPILLGAILIGLLAETYQWKKGPPDNVKVDSVIGKLE